MTAALRELPAAKSPPALNETSVTAFFFSFDCALATVLSLETSVVPLLTFVVLVEVEVDWSWPKAIAGQKKTAAKRSERRIRGEYPTVEAISTTHVRAAAVHAERAAGEGHAHGSRFGDRLVLADQDRDAIEAAAAEIDAHELAARVEQDLRISDDRRVALERDHAVVALDLHGQRFAIRNHDLMVRFAGRMSKGRLTRQELGWLLTQEAAGAAERLRTGVQILKSNPPPEEGGAAGLDATLDALDDTMKMLSSLHNRPVRVTGRRGRIDLAALLWEVAPDARAAIEVGSSGSGTEVFGDEAELRRMLQLLVEHGSGAGSQVSIRRDGDMVKVAVVLGPDATATAEAERAWLARMATRYGGRLDLEGGMEVFSLPADAERVEREALEKELDEARKQGEAYARELAAAFTTTEEGVSPSTFPPPLAGTDVGDRVAVLVRVAGGIAAELRSLLTPAVREIASLSKDDDQKFETIRHELGQVQELAHALGDIGEIDVQELPGPVSVGEVVARQVAHAEGRAQRAGVTVNVIDETEGKAHARTSPRAINALVESLLNQAIQASPRESTVTVRVTDEERGPCVCVDDAGPPLPATARKQFVGLETEPGTYGRPTSLPLYVAAALASWQGATFELDDIATGGLRVRVTFSR